MNTLDEFRQQWFQQLELAWDTEMTTITKQFDDKRAVLQEETTKRLQEAKTAYDAQVATIDKLQLDALAQIDTEQKHAFEQFQVRRQSQLHDLLNPQPLSKWLFGSWQK